MSLLLKALAVPHERKIELTRGSRNWSTSTGDPWSAGCCTRYHVTNASADIRGIFGRACDQLGIEWRPNNPWSQSVARRGSVARLDEFVGPKR